MKKIILFILLVPTLSIAQSREDAKEAAIRAIGQLVSTYRQLPQLSFAVNYRYAAADRPGVYLDSMEGRVIISGQQYWYSMAQTECVLNADYQIMIFKEDKLIYLARPNKDMAASMAMQAMGPQALHAFDSLIRNGQGIHSTIWETNAEQIVQVDFTGHPTYKSLSWFISKETGLIGKMVTVMKAGQLYDASVRSQVDDKDTYAIVETLYTAYQKGGVDENIFRSDRYFNRQGTAYQPSAQYSNYKIFLGSQGL
ncbi:hypothetical protein D3H65_12255 [Paraflavitalea soli]|uniref:Outer membrane lipoprotein carrier protein LolA n=1 Tax=Paraflavitalea soli TaxID=2315862 RepID=A0A3B7MKK2_9BACT|nr:hypothetical protein [Paraflavitalea soli]AXY74708.1 hypothetical protein D3H65_12255 [Paraflavitalea soli]